MSGRHCKKPPFHIQLCMLAVTVCLNTSCTGKIDPKVIKSPENEPAVDLSAWSFAEEGPLRLYNNTWEFYWKQLYAPEDFAADRIGAPPLLIKGACAWNNVLINGVPLGRLGYGTYRLSVKLPEAGRIYSFYIKNQDSAYTLWINGTLLARNGVVASEEENYVPQRLPREFHYYAFKDTAEIVVQVANYTHKWGGLTNNIYLGLPRQIQSFVNGRYGLILFLCGAILIMAFYHLFLFINRRKDPAPLYFSVFCFSLFVWYLFSGDYLFFRLFPAFPLTLGIRLHYLSPTGVLPFFLLFINSVYPKSINRLIFRILFFTSLGLILFPLFTPVHFFAAYILYPFYILVLISSVFIITAIVKALSSRKPGARISLIGAFVFILTVGYDILSDSKIIVGSALRPFAPIGLLVFILFQSFILAELFSSAYERLDHLSKNLEKLVEQRTRELEKAREKIFEKEKLAAIGTLVGSVSHEILNPLSGISGPLSVIKNEILDSPLKSNKALAKHMGYIEDNVETITAAVKNLDALIRDRDILKKPVPLLPVINKITAQYADIPEKNISFQTDLSSSDTVSGDSGILYQIANNIIANAVDSITGDGVIRVSLDKNGPYPVLTVSDTGKGMSPEESAQAFDAFFTTKEPAGGRGLGLFLTEKLASRLGWDIELDSRQNEGTTVKIVFSP